MPLFGFPVEAGQPDAQPGQTPAGHEMRYSQNATFLLQLCKKNRRYKEYCIDKENLRFIKTLKDPSRKLEQTMQLKHKY